MTRTVERPARMGAVGGNRIGRSAFTLIELLVVMAITVILLGLIFGPMIQGFDLTNRARVQAQTQDTARRAMEIGMRDISNGVFIFDNAQEPINLWVHALDASSNPIIAAMPTPYAMVDLVPPARATDQDATIQAKDVDPTTGLALNRGDLALPVAPGRVIVRYFLGLRDNTSTANQPVKPYANFYSSPRTLTLAEHNPIIFFRAVVSPYLPDGTVDQRFFAKDLVTGAPIVYDPNFFYDTTAAPAGLPPIPGFTSKNAAYQTRGYGERWENWKSIARAMVPTDRADEVVPQLDDSGNVTYFTFNNIQYPRLNPLVRFQPTYVGNDAGAPSSVSDLASGAISVAPSTYVEQYGHWTTPFRLYMYRSELDANPLLLFAWLNQGQTTDAVSDQKYDPVSQALTSVDAFLQPNQNPKAYGINVPQTLLLDPQTGIQINPSTGSKLYNNPPLVLFTTDARRGLVNCVFPDSIMMHDSKANNYRATPSQWLSTDVATINSNFKLITQNSKRFIRLPEPPSNSKVSPLNTLANVSIVPGSDIVHGPDQLPGPHRGKEIVYTRVYPNDVSGIGPNQYEIMYNGRRPGTYPQAATLLEEMDNVENDAFNIIFDSHPATGGAIGDLPELDADGNPGAPITVTYQLQSNGIYDQPTKTTSGYTVKADYLTRQLMTFSLGVRLYEFNSKQPQQVVLTQKIKVRNLQR